jgi:hypothetical protein
VSFFATWQYLITLFQPIYRSPAGFQVTFDLLFQRVLTFSLETKEGFNLVWGGEGNGDGSPPKF